MIRFAKTIPPVCCMDVVNTFDFVATNNVGIVEHFSDLFHDGSRVIQITGRIVHCIEVYLRLSVCMNRLLPQPLPYYCCDFL